MASILISSLARLEERAGEGRFVLLETIRQYARERLQEGAGWQDAHDAHAMYFASLAEDAELELKGPDELR